MAKKKEDAKTEAPKAKAQKAAPIRIRSRGASFWRAGLHFTRDGVDIDPAALTAKQRAALIAEPQLLGTDALANKK